MRMGGDVKVKAEPEMSDSKMTAVENRKQLKRHGRPQKFVDSCPMAATHRLGQGLAE